MSWQVTATTINCEFVGDFATIMVYPDHTAKCAFVNKHGKTKDGQKKLRTCRWPDCPLVSDFRESAFAI
jgi:hypothetical protein